MKLQYIVAGLMLLIIAGGFASASFANSTAINYPYPFTATFANVSVITPCIITAYDLYGTPTQVWTSDANNNLLSTNTNGNINSFIVFNNNFVDGLIYNLTLQCGLNEMNGTVYIDTGGTSTINILTLNVLQYFNAKPNQTSLAIIIVVISIFGVIIFIKAVQENL